MKERKKQTNKQIYLGHKKRQMKKNCSQKLRKKKERKKK